MRMPRKNSKRKSRLTPGTHLRAARLALRFTLRDVEAKTIDIAVELKEPRFTIPFARLHELEAARSLPNIFRLYALSRVYKQTILEILRWYRIPVPSGNPDRHDEL